LITVQSIFLEEKNTSKMETPEIFHALSSKILEPFPSEIKNFFAI
jgi:hypothetical protein